MVLKDIINGLQYERVIGNILVEVTGLCHTDDEVVLGDLFFCISGEKNDGHEFAYEAVSRGASALVCEREIDLPVPQVVVKDVRLAMGVIASQFYGNPKDKLKIIGVTGTNGKTTTCHIIRNVLRFAGHNVGLIGTLGVFYSGVEIAPSLTTPDPIFLHKVFADMLKAGVEYVVMEVSAHAVALRKLKGIRFEVGIFTNCTQDHLDFFGDMDTYAKAKAEFLTSEYCDFTVYNADDERGMSMYLSAGKKALTYGLDNPSDVFAINVKEELSGTAFIMNLFDNVFNVKCRMAGLFSVYNCLAAATGCAVLGVDFDDIVGGIRLTEGVSGRVEMIKNKQNKKIFVDYAHTPDGLKNILQTLKKCTAGQLLCVFGCGGNRDKGKRSVMGEISGEYADFTVLTSDNPRYEEPYDIIGDIETGLRKKTVNYITIQDRKSAIRYAVSKMGENDVLLIAGKGAEEYQEIMGIRHDYSDKKYLQKLLGEGGGD